MKYFIDTEFIEGFHKPLFGKRRHFNVIHPIEINLYQQLSPVEKDRHYSNRGKSAFKYYWIDSVNLTSRFRRR